MYFDFISTIVFVHISRNVRKIHSWHRELASFQKLLFEERHVWSTVFTEGTGTVFVLLSRVPFLLYNF